MGTPSREFMSFNSFPKPIGQKKISNQGKCLDQDESEVLRKINKRAGKGIISRLVAVGELGCLP